MSIQPTGPTNPDHYSAAGDSNIECVDAIRAALGEQGFMCFAAGNVMKYVWRASRKNGVEDLGKASVYLDWMIEQSSIKVTLVTCVRWLPMTFAIR